MELRMESMMRSSSALKELAVTLILTNQLTMAVSSSISCSWDSRSEQASRLSSFLDSFWMGLSMSLSATCQKLSELTSREVAVWSPTNLDFEQVQFLSFPKEYSTRLDFFSMISSMSSLKNSSSLELPSMKPKTPFRSSISTSSLDIRSSISSPLPFLKKSPLKIALSIPSFREATLNISDSQELLVIRRQTVTSCFWPMRWALAVAWMSFWGFQSESKMTISVAAVRLIPTPPALVEIRKTCTCWSSQKREIALVRSAAETPPWSNSHRKLAFSRCSWRSSSTATNWEKMRVFLPCCWNLVSSFSSRMTFPLESRKAFSGVSASWRRELSSWGLIRKGWLQHFLNCIARLFRLALLSPLMISFLFLSNSPLYTFFWVLVISTSIITYDNFGIIFSTSSFTLRNKYGRNTFFKRSTFPVLRLPYSATNPSSWGKWLGCRQFRRDHSYLVVFWRGVPVRRVARGQGRARRQRERAVLGFFILWASSTTMCWKGMSLMIWKCLMKLSQLVRKMVNLGIWDLVISPFLLVQRQWNSCCWQESSPCPCPSSQQRRQLKLVQASISRLHCWRVVRGASTRKGPSTFSFMIRWQRNAMIWMVLPRPISSARMQLRFWYQFSTSQLRDSFWNSLSSRQFLKVMTSLPLQVLAGTAPAGLNRQSFSQLNSMRGGFRTIPCSSSSLFFSLKASSSRCIFKLLSRPSLVSLLGILLMLMNSSIFQGCPNTLSFSQLLSPQLISFHFTKQNRSDSTFRSNCFMSSPSNHSQRKGSSTPISNHEQSILLGFSLCNSPSVLGFYATFDVISTFLRQYSRYRSI